MRENVYNVLQQGEAGGENGDVSGVVQNSFLAFV
jgi:hypothetical protein